MALVSRAADHFFTHHRLGIFYNLELPSVDGLVLPPPPSSMPLEVGTENSTLFINNRPYAQHFSFLDSRDPPPRLDHRHDPGEPFSSHMARGRGLGH